MNFSKPSPTGVLICWVALLSSICAQRQTAPGQTAQGQTVRERRKLAKLAEPWLKSATWSLSFAAAKTRAERERKLIFAYFTRSYAP